MEAAKLFIPLWPECRAWHVTILTHEKRAVVHRQAVGARELLANLNARLRPQQVHVFIRYLSILREFLIGRGSKGARFRDQKRRKKQEESKKSQKRPAAGLTIALLA